jgi:hypothetical protein
VNVRPGIRQGNAKDHLPRVRFELCSGGGLHIGFAADQTPTPLNVKVSASLAGPPKAGLADRTQEEDRP